jgi:hypothetical protein
MRKTDSPFLTDCTGWKYSFLKSVGINVRVSVHRIRVGGDNRRQQFAFSFDDFLLAIVMRKRAP